MVCRCCWWWWHFLSDVCCSAAAALLEEEGLLFHPLQQLEGCRLVVRVGQHVLRDARREDFVELGPIFLIPVRCSLCRGVSQFVGALVGHSIHDGQHGFGPLWLLDFVS